MSNSKLRLFPGGQIKAITLWQPWATLMAIGAKKIETRSWLTSHRGSLAIHAAKRDTDLRETMLQAPFRSVLARAGYRRVAHMPLGCIVAIVDLDDIYSAGPMGELLRDNGNMQELTFGDYAPGRFAWYTINARLPSKPVPAKGAQQLWWWTIPDDMVLIGDEKS